jgi:indolepyruvate ferredoxin oxidoreductase beta subunit
MPIASPAPQASAIEAVGAQRRISIAILAIGGQGGGVLADWLVDLAEHAGWLAQTTSVPGVAQRTGATIYYAELFPEASADAAGRAPVLALMPTSGDVDVVVAAELMEAGRAMQRGLVTPDRTTLIASSHRSYAILEKSALGNGMADPERVHAAARAVAKRYIAFDMAALAQAHGSVISASLFGALAGCRVLPFERAQFEAAIRRGGVGVEASLRAFAAACERAQTGGDTGGAARAAQPAQLPRSARDPGVTALLERVHRDFPAPARAFTVEGLRRLVDYLDVEYAADYLRRLDTVRAVDARTGGEAMGWRLTVETARYLALRMAYEDTLRVADLKTRATRFERFRSEVRAAPDQIVYATEYLHPRVQEIADTLPAGLGRWLLDTAWARNFVARRFARGRFLRTTTLPGFVLLWTLGQLRGYRRRTLRYASEMRDLDAWLGRIENIAAQDYALACELAESARVLKGYSETYERGRRSFDALMAAADRLCGTSGAAAALRRLREAALQDEDGCALTAAMQALALPVSAAP